MKSKVYITIETNHLYNSLGWLFKLSFNPKIYCRADYIVLAQDRYGLAGIWKFNYKNYPKWRQGGEIFSLFTWISKRHRGRGLAKYLWKIGVEHTGAKSITASIASENGRRLIDAMMREYDIKIIGE